MRNETARTEMNGKVINLHYTDICNYRCRFCYARFGTTPLSLDDWKRSLTISSVMSKSSASTSPAVNLWLPLMFRV